VIAVFNLIRKNLAARKLRLVITSFAVLLGVAFMAGTLVFTDTIGRTFDGLFADANEGTDGYVRGELAFDNEVLGEQRPRVDTALIDQITALPGVRAAEGYSEAYAQIVDKNGEAMGNPDMGAPVLGSHWITDDALNAFDIESGRPPAADDEVVIDVSSFRKGGFALGDSTTVLTQAGPAPVTIVGTASFAGADSPAGASVTLFTPSAAQHLMTGEGMIDAIRVAAADGVSQEELVAQVSSVLPRGVEVLTGEELTEEQQSQMAEDMGFLRVFLMVFAVIALFVGSFIIYNSFSILVAQRRKEMALLRAIGAGRRQVLSSVLVEAGAVGMIASVAGLVAGVGVAAGLKAMMSAMGIDLPSGSVVVSTGTIVISVVTGVLVSLVSAIFPARRASKVPPIAALREVALDRSGTSKRRAVIGTTVTGLGAAAMFGGLFGGAGIMLLALGAPTVFVGVAVLGPILARPISRVLGAPLARLRGMPGALARQNAMRNPKRTSTTAAALMIGVALVGFITILAASTHASVESSVDRTFTGDLIVSAGNATAGGLSPQLAADVAALPEIDHATGFRMAAVEIEGTGSVVNAADRAEVDSVLDLDIIEGSLSDLELGTIAVHEDIATSKGLAPGDTIPVEFAATGVHPLRVAAIYTELTAVGDYLVGLDTFEANVTDQFDSMVAMTVTDGVSVDAARAAVSSAAAAYPQAEVQDREEYVAAALANLDTMLNLIYALLALAVFIALLGIANTLALSIFERTRELGLLRAVGMTRSQLRAMVRWEATIIALLGTTLGLAIGTGFGWAIVTALNGEGLTTFTVPVGQLVVITLIAAGAGVLAAILPARRAARLDVLAAITSE
jgi:putative ABC transport system permease protein